MSNSMTKFSILVILIHGGTNGSVSWLTLFLLLMSGVKGRRREKQTPWTPLWIPPGTISDTLTLRTRWGKEKLCLSHQVFVETVPVCGASRDAERARLRMEDHLCVLFQMNNTNLKCHSFVPVMHRTHLHEHNKIAQAYLHTVPETSQAALMYRLKANEIYNQLAFSLCINAAYESFYQILMVYFIWYNCGVISKNWSEPLELTGTD